VKDKFELGILKKITSKNLSETAQQITLIASS
jgi:hypothetical protein